MLWDSLVHARAGKRLLDQGGRPAEISLVAKLCALEACKLDEALVTDVDSLVAAYIESSEGMQAAMIYPHVSSLEAVDFARYAETCRGRSNTLHHMRALLSEPLIPLELSASERTAASLLQIRKCRANVAQTLGLRCRPPALAHGERHMKELCCCDDDEEHPSASMRESSRSSRNVTSSLDNTCRTGHDRGNSQNCQVEKLVHELFCIQDLNGDGFLEERELVKLNEKVAVVHYGKDANKDAVKDKFQRLFREKLDPAGQPVPYAVYRDYILQTLNELDPDENAQELIMEQFIAEAETARATFHTHSSPLPADVPHLATLRIQSFDTTITRESTRSGALVVEYPSQ